MARNIRIDRSEAEFLTDLLLSSDNTMAKEIGDEIRDVFGMVSEEKEKQLTDNPINFDTFIAESNELIKKLGDVWATGIKDIYGNQHTVSVDDIINAPVITERLDVSERPIVCDTMTMSEFIKFRDKMARPS